MPTLYIFTQTHVMKVSVITVVFNGEKYIEDCIQSVLRQDYPDIEYILIDGASTDQTIEIVGRYRGKVGLVLSEPDKGLYDALNKGILHATGDVIGFLHADDLFAGDDVVSAIASKFLETGADAVFGNLNYVSATDTQKVLRKWRSYQARFNDMEFGWMPAHPSLYVKQKVYKEIGGYSLDFGTAGDYEFMLRAVYKYRIQCAYLNKLIVKMRIGGQSNAGLANLAHAFWNDYRAAKLHKIPFPMFTTVLKKIRKIGQFFQ